MIFNMRAKEVLGVIESDSTKLVGSYDSVLKINKIGGVCEQGANPSPTNKQEVKNSVISEIRTHEKNFINQPCVPVTDAEKRFLKTGTYIATRDTSEVGGSWYLGAYDSNGNVITQNAIIAQSYALSSTKEYWYGGAAYNFVTFTVNTDCYVRIGVMNGSGKTYLMLNEGTTALPYEPYKGSSVALSKPVELYGIGDIQDIIEGSKVKRNFGVVVLDGSDDEGWNRQAKGQFYMPLDTLAKKNLDNYYNSILCDSYKVIPSHAHTLIEGICGYCDSSNNYPNSNWLYIINPNLDKLEELKSLLNGNPITVVYELAEPTTEVLPTRDQMVLNTLQTFTGVTYIEFVSEVQPTLNSDYATSPVGAVALSVHAYNEIEKCYIKYNDDGSVRFNGNVNVDEWVIANNLQAYQMVYADSLQTYKGITATTDVTAQNNVVAQNELRGKDLHVTNMGVNGGVAQPVEWVWDEVLARWVLCTVQ